MSLPGYKTAKEVGIIIDRAPATITKWCSQGMVEGAEKVSTGKFKIWVIPDGTVEALAKKTPTRAEARRLAGQKTAAKMKPKRRITPEVTAVKSPYPPATPRQIEHDALMAWMENIRR